VLAILADFTPIYTVVGKRFGNMMDYILSIFN
jgi:hypothetical protein